MNTPKPHEQPLLFTEDQLQEMDSILLRLADQIGSPLVMVSDISGRLVLYRGRLSSSQSTGLSALATGGFAAGLEIGNFLGLQANQGFQQQLLEGKAANLYILAVGSELLLMVAFTQKTSLGMVRLFSEETRKRLLRLAETAVIARKKTSAKPDVPLAEGFTDELKGQLDELFSEAVS